MTAVIIGPSTNTNPPLTTPHLTKKDNYDTNRYVRQWHLCERVHYHEPGEFETLMTHPDDPRWSAAATRVAPHTLPTDDCQPRTPSAHVVGPNLLPKLQVFLHRTQIQTFFSPGEIDTITSNLAPSPEHELGWMIQLTIVAVRYDTDRSAMRLLISMDDLHGLRSSADSYERHEHSDRMKRIWNYMFLAVPDRVGMTCQWSLPPDPNRIDRAFGLTSRPIVAVAWTGPEDNTHSFEIHCPFPFAPNVPTSQFQIELKLNDFLLNGEHSEAAEGAAGKGEADGLKLNPSELRASRPSTIIHVCSSLDRLISSVYCGKLRTSHLLPTVVDFLWQHLYYGVELFDFEDKWGLYYPILKPWIEAGTVRYRIGGENIRFFDAQGKPWTQPLYYDQILTNQATCRFRHWHSAKYLLAWDGDEWLVLPPSINSSPHTYAATCLQPIEVGIDGRHRSHASSSSSNKQPLGTTPPLMGHGFVGKLSYHLGDEAEPKHILSQYPPPRHTTTSTFTHMDGTTSADARAMLGYLSSVSGLTYGCRSMLGDYLAHMMSRTIPTSVESEFALDPPIAPQIRLLMSEHTAEDETARERREAYLRHQSSNSTYNGSNVIESHIAYRPIWPIPHATRAWASELRGTCSFQLMYHDHLWSRFPASQTGPSPIPLADSKWLIPPKHSCRIDTHVVGLCPFSRRNWLATSKEDRNVIRLAHFRNHARLRSAPPEPVFEHEKEQFEQVQTQIIALIKHANERERDETMEDK